MTTSLPAPRVLSIQSSVVHGVVGNKAAVFPLMLRGIEVDPLNVVQLCNHGGYPIVTGSRISIEDFKKLFEGLRQNNLLSSYSAILTGYVANVEILHEISEVVKELREIVEKQGQNKQLLFLCDPVCGDGDKLYVNNQVPTAYADKLLPLANIATPNGFEASYLSGIQVVDLRTARRAADWFHSAKGVNVVVITSFVSEDHPNDIFVFASQRCGEREGDKKRVYTRVPCVQGRYSGTGDLFSALFLAEFLQAGNTSNSVTNSDLLAVALERTISVVYNVVQKAAQGSVGDSSHFTELSLAVSQDIINSPPALPHPISILVDEEK